MHEIKYSNEMSHFVDIPTELRWVTFWHLQKMTWVTLLTFQLFKLGTQIGWFKSQRWSFLLDDIALKKHCYFGKHSFFRNKHSYWMTYLFQKEAFPLDNIALSKRSITFGWHSSFKKKHFYFKTYNIPNVMSLFVNIPMRWVTYWDYKNEMSMPFG